MSEKVEKLIAMKHFLLKWFAVGFFFLIFSLIIFILAKDFCVEIANSWFGIEPVFYFHSVFVMFGLVKIFLFFGLLSPATALCWLAKCCEKTACVCPVKKKD